MCFPPLVLAAVLAGAGGVAQYAGAKQAESARMRAFTQERNRQQNFSREQQGLFEDSLARAGQIANPENEAAAVDRRQTAMANIVAPPTGTYLPGSNSAPNVVREAGERANNAGSMSTSALANALARLSGTGDQIFDTNINNARNAGRIGQVGSFMAGSAGAGQAELEAAAHKGSFLRNIGALAQQIGMAAATGGAGGVNVGAKVANKFPIGMSGMPDGLAQMFGQPNVAWGYGG